MLSPTCLRAEEQTGMLGTWRDALKLLDSVSIENRKNAESLLRVELRNPATPVQAALGLAWMCALREDPAGVDKVLAGIAQKFPGELALVAPALHRIELWSALAKNDQEAIPRRLEGLAGLITTGLPDEEGWLTSYFVGAAIGMLDSNRAHSPVTPEAMQSMKQTFANLPNASWKGAFVQAYESARIRSAQFATRLDELEKADLAAVEAEHKERETSFKAMQDAVAAEQEAAAILSKTNEARRTALIAERKRMDAILETVNRESRIPTPGHPGVERLPPSIPYIGDIYVDEFYTVWDTVTDSNGNTSQVQRTVQRSYSDIERERQDRFRQMMSQYQTLKAAYDRYIADYRRALSQWTNNDAQRREKMLNDRNQADQRLQEIRQENERLRAEIDENKRLLSQRISQLKKLQAQVALDNLVIPAVRDGKTERLFRPPVFEPLSISREKRRLLE
jgi:hypothetical protein